MDGKSVTPLVDQCANSLGYFIKGTARGTYASPELNSKSFWTTLFFVPTVSKKEIHSQYPFYSNSVYPISERPSHKARTFRRHRRTRRDTGTLS